MKLIVAKTGVSTKPGSSASREGVSNISPLSLNRNLDLICLMIGASDPDFGIEGRIKGRESILD